MAAVLVLSGCAAGDAAEGDAAQAETASTLDLAETPVTNVGEPLWSLAVQVAGSAPALVDDHVVAYTYEAGELFLNSWDLESGELAWSLPASLSGLPVEKSFKPEVITGADGNPIVVNLFDSLFTHPSGYEETLQSVQFIDPATGTVQSAAEPDWFSNWFPCGENDEYLCVTALDELGEKWLSRTLDASGTFMADLAVGQVGDRRLTHDLYLVDRADGSSALVSVKDGSELWSLDGQTLGLPEGNVGSAFLGNQYVSDENILVLTVNTGLAEDIERQLTDRTVSVIDVLSGEILWQTGGMMGWNRDGHVHFDGTQEMVRQPTGSFVTGKADFIASGVDLRTGEKTWSTTLHGMEFERAHSPYEWSVPGYKERLIRIEDDPFIFDLSSGELRHYTADQMFQCLQVGSPFELPNPHAMDGSLKTYTGSAVVAGCTIEKSTSDIAQFSQAVVISGSPSPWGVERADWDEGEEQYRAIFAESGLHVYRF